MLYKALHNVNMQTYRDACIHSTTRTYSVRYTSHYRKTTVSPIILNQLLLPTNFTNSTRSLRTCELSYQPSCRADNTQCMHGCHPKWFSRLSLFWFKKQSWSQAPYTFFFLILGRREERKGSTQPAKGTWCCGIATLSSSRPFHWLAPCTWPHMYIDTCIYTLLHKLV